MRCSPVPPRKRPSRPQHVALEHEHHQVLAQQEARLHAAAVGLGLVQALGAACAQGIQGLQLGERLALGFVHRRRRRRAAGSAGSGARSRCARAPRSAAGPSVVLLVRQFVGCGRRRARRPRRPASRRRVRAWAARARRGSPARARPPAPAAAPRRRRSRAPRAGRRARRASRRAARPGRPGSGSASASCSSCGPAAARASPPGAAPGS